MLAIWFEPIWLLETALLLLMTDLLTPLAICRQSQAVADRLAIPRQVITDKDEAGVQHVNWMLVLADQSTYTGGSMRILQMRCEPARIRSNNEGGESKSFALCGGVVKPKKWYLTMIRSPGFMVCCLP